MENFRILFITTVRLHKYLLSIGIFLLFLYVGYLNYLFLFKVQDVGNLFQLSSFLIQSGMLFFMFLGYRIARKTKDEKHLSQILSNKIKIIHLFHSVFLILIVTLFLTIFSTFYKFYFGYMDPNNTFWIKTLWFLINNWLLPFIITALIGYLFGMNSKNVLIYVLLLIVWGCISPANLNFLSNLFANTQLEEAVSWLKNLNIGIYNMNDLYHPFYGFEFEWLKKIGLLVFLLVLMYLSVTFNGINVVRKLYLILVVIGLLLFGSIPYQFSKPNILDNIQLQSEEYKYYSSELTIPEKKYFLYKILNINVKIENKEQFNVSVDMTINNESQTNLAFSLYKRFIIKDISLSDGQKLRFEQEGDHVIVEIPDNMVNSLITLKFAYSGIGSPSNPALEDYVYLPSDFNWLPSNHSTTSRFLFNEEFIQASLKNEKPIEYTLTYKGEKPPTFINLKEFDGRRYKGSTNGITLVSGDLTKMEMADKTVYYPRSWFVYNKEIASYIKEFNYKLEKYNDIFSTDYITPKNVVLLPSMDLNDTYMYVNSLADSYHILLQVNPVLITQKAPINNLISYQIDRAYNVNNNYNNPEKFANWFIYNSFLGDFLNDKPADKNLLFFQLYLAEPYIDSNEMKLYQRLAEVDKNKINKKLFVKWKELLLEQEENDGIRLGQVLEVLEIIN